MSLPRGSRSAANGPAGVVRNPRKTVGHTSHIKVAPIRTKSGCESSSPLPSAYAPNVHPHLIPFWLLPFVLRIFYSGPPTLWSILDKFYLHTNGATSPGWTCRLRRKRCDEKRLPDGTCETCARLRIDCLGWGAKRPDWCRDKKKVTEFLGKTRNGDALACSNFGNRFTSPTTPPFDPLSGLPYSNPTSHFHGHAALGQPTFTMDHTFDPADYDDMIPFYMLHTTTTAPPAPSASISSIVEGAMSGRLDALPDTTSHVLMTTMPSPNVQWDSTYISQGPFPETSFYPTGDSSLNLTSGVAEFFTIAQYESPSRLMTDTPKEWVNSLQQIQYYFSRVRKMQYCFAGSATTDIMKDMVTGDPNGVVANAICALAAVHDYLMRQVAGHQVEDWQGAKSLPRQFFDFANSQIEASREKNGRYTAADATAALQFVSFSLFVGGHSGWELALKVAGDWYETTPVLSHEQPLRAMWELDNTAKFASRIFLWFDIFSAITLLAPPRFLHIYRRILGNEGGFWRRGLNMETTMGCPDDVLLAIAETANLAHWKEQQKQKNSLNYRELARRGEEIEKALRAGEKVHAEEEAHQRRLEDQRAEVTRRITSSNPAALAASSSSSVASSSGSSGMRSPSSSPRMSHSLPLRPEGLDDLEVQSRAGRIFRAGAHLYLASVVSDCKSRAPEVSTAVDDAIIAVQNLPCSDVDKSLVFPLCIGGCLSATENQKNIFRGRLSPHQTVGNCHRAVEVIDAVWAKREAVATGTVVDWRKCMEELGFQLLLV